MANQIPPNAADVAAGVGEVGSENSNSAREHLEFELLEAEREIRKLLHREVSQRFLIRWVAVVTGLIVVVAMSVGLAHLIHKVFWGPFIFVSPAFAVAMIVAPIASITAITVTLFIGAFRKFEDQDMQTVGNGMSGFANWMGRN